MTDDDDNHAKPRNTNCLELTMEPSYGVSSQATIHWILETASSRQILADGTIQPNETTATACWEEEQDLDCASLDIFHISDPSYYGTMRVVWNGTVWANEPFSQRPPPFDHHLVWLGDRCHEHQYQVCGYSDDTWLLDVGLTTSKYVNAQSQIYWRVYTEFDGHWGNQLHDPYYNRYQPDTTYRTLHCMQLDFGGCTEFGLYGKSEAIVSNLTLRVDGKIKTSDNWECDHELCEGDIVTPLRGCSSRAFTDAEIAGIVIAVVFVTPVILVGLAWAWHSAKSQARFNREQSGEARERGRNNVGEV